MPLSMPVSSFSAISCSFIERFIAYIESRVRRARILLSVSGAVISSLHRVATVCVCVRAYTLLQRNLWTVDRGPFLELSFLFSRISFFCFVKKRTSIRRMDVRRPLIIIFLHVSLSIDRRTVRHDNIYAVERSISRLAISRWLAIYFLRVWCYRYHLVHSLPHMGL